MAELDKGLEIPHGLSLNNQVGIWPTTTNPSTGGGLDLPIGSLALQTDKVLWRKIGASTTDWTKKHFDPEKTVMVAKSGGDYTSVKDACDYVDSQTPSGSSPWTVLVFPGNYLEVAFTVPDYCSLISIGGLSSAVLTPVVGSITFITCGAYSEVSGFRISGAGGSGGVGIQTSDLQSLIRSCVVTNCETGILITGAGADAVVEDVIVDSAPGSTVTTALKVDGGATATVMAVSIAGTASSMLTTGVLLTGTNTKCTLSTTVVGYATTGFSFVDGAYAIVSGSAAENCITGFNHDGASTAANTNSSSCRDCTTDVNIASSGVVGYFIGSADLTKVNLGGNTKFLLNVTQMASGDEGVKIVGELSVGHPYRPSESCFGEGDSSVLDMFVFSNDNGTSGTWVDNTAAAKSVVGSTFSMFQGVAAENCCYVGNTERTFPGVKVEGLLPALDIGTGSLVVEYWNGAWTEIHVMETNADPPFDQHADALFQTTGNIQVRLDDVTDWSLTTLNTVNAYWLRFRIVTAVTTAPTAERIKCHTNRAEINRDGFTEFFGGAEQTRQISLSPLAILAGFSASSYIVDAHPDTRLQLWYVRRDNNKKDGSGSNFQLPRGLDTSKPIVFHVLWAKTTNAGGSVENEVNLTRLRSTGGDVLDGTLPTQKKEHIADVTGGVAHQTYESEFEFYVEDGLPEDVYYWTHVRDATNGNPDDDYGAATYLVGWSLTGTFWR